MTTETPTNLTGKKEKFIELYPKCYTVTATCRAVAISRETFYEWCKTDNIFAQQEYKYAQEAVADDLEAEAIRRGKEKSDVLTIFVLKGLKPEKYGEKLQHNVAIQTSAQFLEELKKAAGE